MFVWEPNDLSAFATAKAAERYIEPYDVDTFDVYDAEGRKLRFEVRAGDVFLHELEETPTHQGELRRVLADAFAAVGVRVSPTEPLDVLVKHAAERFDIS